MEGKVKKKRGRKPKEVKAKKEDINKITLVKDNHIIKLTVNKFDNDEIDGYLEGNNELDILPENSTSKLCWNCCHPFDDIPYVYGIPLKYINEIFYTYGDFCSLECAARYVYEHFKNKNMWEIFSLINLYNITINKDITKIEMAPSKLHLKSFGGDLTIEDYRSKFKKNSLYDIQIPPIIPINHNTEMYEMKNNTKNDNLKLYRKKKLPSEKKSITNTMDLQINKD